MTAFEFFSSVKRKNHTLFFIVDGLYIRTKVQVQVHNDSLDVRLTPGASLTVDKDFPVTYFKGAYYLKGIKIRICDEKGGDFLNGL